MTLPKKVHWFVMTDWNCLDREQYMKIMAKNNIKFLAFGRETCPTSKRKHHQCFMYFKGSRAHGKLALKRMGGWWGETHNYVCAALGNQDANAIYCQKESELEKVGTEPKQGAKTDLEDTCKEILNGKITVDDIAKKHPMHYHMYGRTLERVQTLQKRTQWRTWMTEGIWYFGKTGSGKSHQAYDMENYHPDTHYILDLQEDWWDGYVGQEYIIINEFKGQIPFGQLMDLCDKYPKTVKTKCREKVPFLAKKIVIASISRPEHCYRNLSVYNSDIGELYRRFKCYECTCENGKYAVLPAEAPIICADFEDSEP